MDAEKRIAELEAELIAKNARIAEQDARIAAQDARIEALVRQVEALTARLGRNSGNSDLPPSSDPPGASASKKGKRSKGKQRGGQLGHRGSRRALLAADRVDDVVDFFPAHSEHCRETLPKIPDPWAKRYQFTELPAFEPHTTECRRHAVECPRCRERTRAPYESGKIPNSPFGPRLMGAVALLTGVYHLSRRKAVQLLSDLVGVRISLGAVSAVEARVSELSSPRSSKRASTSPTPRSSIRREPRGCRRGPCCRCGPSRRRSRPYSRSSPTDVPRRSSRCTASCAAFW